MNRNLQTEIDVVLFVPKLAESESDPVISEVYRQMSAIENGHAEAFAKRMNVSLENLIRPSWRAMTLNVIGKIFGYDYVLGALMDTEKSLSSAIISTKKRNKQQITGTETNHVKILRSILEKEEKITGAQIL